MSESWKLYYSFSDTDIVSMCSSWWPLYERKHWPTNVWVEQYCSRMNWSSMLSAYSKHSFQWKHCNRGCYVTGFRRTTVWQASPKGQNIKGWPWAKREQAATIRSPERPAHPGDHPAVPGQVQHPQRSHERGWHRLEVQGRSLRRPEHRAVCLVAPGRNRPEERGLLRVRVALLLTLSLFLAPKFHSAFMFLFVVAPPPAEMRWWKSKCVVFPYLNKDDSLCFFYPTGLSFLSWIWTLVWFILRLLKRTMNYWRSVSTIKSVQL